MSRDIRVVHRGVATVALVLLATGFVSAQLIVPLSQERRLYCSADALDFFDEVNDSDSDGALDFLPFGGAISARAELDIGLGTGGAIQQSEILSDGIVATGSSFATGESFDFEGQAEGSGLSRMHVTFTLTADSNYRMGGMLAAFDRGFAEVNLLQGAISIYNEIAFGPAQEDFIDQSGALTAGEYTLRIDASGSAFGESFQSEYAFSEYDILFRVGEPGAGGEVPDGLDVPGGPALTARWLPNGRVRLNWGLSCRIDDTDYTIYEGDLMNPHVMTAQRCSTDGLLQWDVTPIYDAAYFLVVPNNGVTEGSYGDDSEGVERIPSTSQCFSQSLGDPICY